MTDTTDDFGGKTAKWGLGKIIGYVVNLLSIGVAAAALTPTLYSVADAPTAFATLPQPAATVDVATVTDAQIADEQQSGVGKRIFSENQNNQAVQSMAGMLLGRFNDLDLYDIKVEYVNTSDVNLVANSDLLDNGQPLTPDQRVSLAAYLVDQQRLTNQLVDSENAKKDGHFQTDKTAVWTNGDLSIQSPSEMIILFCLFCIAALAGVYILFVRNFGGFIHELAHTAMLGVTIFALMIFVNMADYKQRSGFALISPLFGHLQHTTLIMGAIGLAGALVLYLFSGGVKVFIKDLGVVLMSLLVIGSGFASLQNAFHLNMLPVFGACFVVGLVMWFFTVEAGDFGYKQVSAIMRRKVPDLPVPAPLSDSPLPGIIGLVVVAAAAVTAAWMLYSFFSMVSTGDAAVDMTTKGSFAFDFGLLSLIGLDAWLACIVARNDGRGEGFATAGFRLGIISLFAVPVLVGMIMGAKSV